MRIPHEPVGQAADVDQSAVGQPNVHERPEVDDIQHGAGQLHARLEIFQLDDAATEHGCRQVFAGIATRPGQRVEDIAQQQFADRQLTGQRLRVQPAHLFLDVAHRLRRAVPRRPRLRHRRGSTGRRGRSPTSAGSRTRRHRIGRLGPRSRLAIQRRQLAATAGMSASTRLSSTAVGRATATAQSAASVLPQRSACPRRLAQQ